MIQAVSSSQTIRVLGPHEPLLHSTIQDQVEIYPLLEGDNHSRQRGGVVKNNLIINDAKQYRSRRQYAGDSHPNTCASLSTWETGRRKPTQELNGLWLYGGFAIDHFGHFIADSCHRLWPLLEQRNDPIEGVLLIGQEQINGNTSQLKSFHREIIFYLNKKRLKITVATKSLRVEQLLIATQANTLGPLSEPQMRYINLLSQPNRRSLWRHNQKRAYVSRSKLKTQSRLIGENVIEDILRRAGFHIFHPEDHSFQEQINFYKSAKTLVFCEGSAIHSLDLAGQISADVIIISRGGLRNKRNRSLQSSLKKTAHSCVLFSDVQRHPAFRQQANIYGHRIPVHWESGVWLNHQQLASLLRLIKIPERLIPCQAEYKRLLSPHLLDYLITMSYSCSQSKPSSARALCILLAKIAKI